MAKLRVDLNIPAERYVPLYAGQARNIYAMAEGGLSVQFPGSAMRKFVLAKEYLALSICFSISSTN